MVIALCCVQLNLASELVQGWPKLGSTEGATSTSYKPSPDAKTNFRAWHTLCVDTCAAMLICVEKMDVSSLVLMTSRRSITALKPQLSNLGLNGSTTRASSEAVRSRGLTLDRNHVLFLEASTFGVIAHKASRLLSHRSAWRGKL